MSNRRSFLINTVFPEFASEGIFDVRENAVRLTVNFLGLTENVAHVQVWVGNASVGEWVYLHRQGEQVILTPENNDIVEIVPGKYRVIPKYNDDDDVACIVWMEEIEVKTSMRYRKGRMQTTNTAVLADGEYGGVTVADNGSSIHVTDGDYGSVQVTADGQTWTVTGDNVDEPLVEVSSENGILTVDAGQGDYFVTVLHEDVVEFTLLNPPVVGYGQTVKILIVQDAATPRLVWWPAAFQWVGGIPGTVSASIGAVDLLELVTFDQGVTWQATLTNDRTLQDELLLEYDITNTATLWQDVAGLIPATTAGHTIARIDDLTGNGYTALQANATYRPTIPAAGLRLRGDFSNDYMEVTPLSAGGHPPVAVLVVNTPWGWYTSRIRNQLLRLPLCDATHIRVYRYFTTGTVAALTTLWGPRKFFVGLMNQFTHVRFGPAEWVTVDYIGANGASTTRTFFPDYGGSDLALAGSGLTAPVAIVIPDSVVNTTGALGVIDSSGPHKIYGAYPDITRLPHKDVYFTAGFVGHIPTWGSYRYKSTLQLQGQQLTGTLPNFPAVDPLAASPGPYYWQGYSLRVFYAFSGLFTGTIPPIPSYMNTLAVNNNPFSPQSFPALPAISYDISLQACNLTGVVPSLSHMTIVQRLRFADNPGLTGSFPSLSTMALLDWLYGYGCSFSGDIPTLSGNPILTRFYAYDNLLTGYAGGGVSATLGDFRAQNNLLTEAAVDALLADFVAANKTTGTRTLNLGGTGNATPSAAGLADKAILQSRGWTVTTN